MTALYWIAVIAATILLAYVSPFNIAPIAFLVGGAAIALGYYAFLSYRRSRSGVWEHSTHQYRFAGTVFVFVIVFWTVLGIYTNQKEKREFWARYEPNVTDGVQHGYTFYYLDYANSYERVDSPILNKIIEEKKPEKVKVVLEVVRDFGSLRSYSIDNIESVKVGATHIGGEPPWAALRAK